MSPYDVTIIGAGAAGLFCAAQAGQRGLRVLLVDNGKKPGRKILMSGGGRCNFTNLHALSEAWLSANPHFHKSALACYRPEDFLQLVASHRIAWHEKTAGQLFCDDSAQQIVTMLLNEVNKGQVTLRMRSTVQAVARQGEQFHIQIDGVTVQSHKLVVASGGLSMPGLSASPFGYHLAQQFGLNILPVRAGLVPLTLHKPLLERLCPLAGVALRVAVTAQNKMTFEDDMLFTHRGLSGPAILQISNYWRDGEQLVINLLPEVALTEFLATQRHRYPDTWLKTALAKLLPKRVVDLMLAMTHTANCKLKQIDNTLQQQLAHQLHHWSIQPAGTEGYRTAEVTLGGVDTRDLISKTLQARHVNGLFFIGEVVDITGWLGGYNFQWAWSSAWACAQAL